MKNLLLKKAAPLFIDTLKEIPNELSWRVGQPSMRAYAALGGAITGKPLTPSTPFQKDLYGTEKPITFRSVGEEILPEGNKAAPFLGAFFGLADLVPGGQVPKKATKALLPKVQPVFQGLKNLSTKLLEKFKGMPEEITPQQFNEVINRAQKEGIRKADLDLIKEMMKRQIGKVDYSGSRISKLSKINTTTPGGAQKLADKKYDIASEPKTPDEKAFSWFNDWIQAQTGRDESVFGKSPTKEAIQFYDKPEYKPTGPITVYRAMKGGEKMYPTTKYTSWTTDQRIAENFLDEFDPRSRMASKVVQPDEVFLEFDKVPPHLRPEVGEDILGDTEHEVILKSLNDVKKISQVFKINLLKLAKDVETQLVPLTPTPVKSPRWSDTGKKFIGDGKYGEIVYQSPIKTSAGDVHFEARGLHTFPNQQRFSNYFSHIRYEDLVDGKTRKILETQSDLFQKENFERELEKDWVPSKKNKFEATFRDVEKRKLEVYNSNDPFAHLRTFREEVKRAAKDGKDTILIPSGETAMKIEGLWEDKIFRIAEPYPNKLGGRTIPNMDIAKVLTPEQIKYGIEINPGTSGQMSHDTIIIIEDKGEGKFRAVSSEIWDEAKRWKEGIEKKSFLNNKAENYDLYNKNLESHFVYKLNEEAIPREARKMGLQVEKVPNLNVPDKFNMTTRETVPGSWWKITNIKGEHKKPTFAFGHTNIATLLGGSAVTGAGVIASSLFAPLFVPSKTTYQTKTTYQKEEEQKQITSPEVLKTTLMQLESSGGTDKTSADEGEIKWLIGLTNIAIKELKRVGLIDDSFDKNDREDVLNAGVKYFQLMRERNPNLSDAEIYVDKYWTQTKSEEQRQKRINDFNELVN